jgi:lycopene cyclase domain-containing protein
MTYWGLNAIFLGVVALVAIAALVVGARRRASAAHGDAPARTTSDRTTSDRTSGTPGARTTPGARAASIALAVAILLVMTAVFDNVMIGIGLVGYDAAKISGVFIGIAPLEDFSYSVAALILLPSLWVLLGSGRRRPTGEAHATERHHKAHETERHHKEGR